MQTRLLRRLLLVPLGALLLLSPFGSASADVTPPVSQRFAAESDETPDFRRHLVPLIGKLGCNGRACHGAFQGQGGFRLSLFGYDFKLDHEQLTAGEQPRINPEDPEDSLALRKPLLLVPHKGGKRLEPDSWQHRLFVRWIESGAKPVPEQDTRSIRLEVTPPEIDFTRAGDTVSLHVVAHWSDGHSEDVTPLCRFQTNNEQLAQITDAGVVTAGDPGDTHVVVFYDAAVVPVPVVRPVSEFSGDKYPQIPTPTRVDELVVAKWKKLGLIPSELAGDAEFLRRVSLDITGTLPAPDEIEQFLADADPLKRTRKIDELLERPAYAAWWATQLCDLTGNNPQQLLNATGANQERAAQDWYDWIRRRLETNVPYDQLVAGIVLATSREPGETYAQYSERLSGLYGKDARGHYADSSSLTWYWSRRNFRQPEERAQGFAYAFLGLRIQCAQCHKHPFDRWTQDDYQQFSAFFTRVGYGIAPGDKSERQQMLASLGLDKKKGNDAEKELNRLLADGKTVPFQELFVTPPGKAAPIKKQGNGKKNNRRDPAPQTGRLLGGDTIDLAQHADARTPLMDWLRDRNNPYFARSIVNRVWAGYFERGIVHPTDDFCLANPPSNAPLLDELARGFIDHNYDLKWLHRTIASSRVYQLSWQTNPTNLHDDRNFSRSQPRRLPAEVAYDAIAFASASDADRAAWQVDLSSRAIALAGRRGKKGKGFSDYALQIFGRSVRESNCDCDRSSEASLLQTVYLQNDSEFLARLDRPDSWPAQVVRGKLAVSPDADDQVAAAAAPKKGEPMTADEIRAQIAKVKKRLAKETDPKQQERLKKRLKALERRLAKLEANPEPKPELEAEPEPEATESSAPARSEPLSSPRAEQIVRQAYLRTLSRHSTADEATRASRFLTESESLEIGVRGLLWALLNTKEFIVNH